MIYKHYFSYYTDSNIGSCIPKSNPSLLSFSPGLQSCKHVHASDDVKHKAYLLICVQQWMTRGFYLFIYFYFTFIYVSVVHLAC